MSKIKTIALTFLIFVAAAVAGKYIGIFSAKISPTTIPANQAESVRFSEHNLTLSLKQLADEMNKRLPVDDGQGLITESVTTGPGRMMTFSYRISVLSSEEVDQSIRDSIREGLISSRCNSGPVRDLLINGVDVVLVYNASDGKQILRVLHPAHSCRP